MAGYSGTSLAQKLGIKAGQKVITLGAPAGYRKLLSPLPDDVSFATNVEPNAAFIHLFVSQRATPGERTETTSETDRGHRNPLGVVAEKIFRREDGHNGRRHPRGLSAARFVDIKVCAVDETWSGLKLMIRRDNRR